MINSIGPTGTGKVAATQPQEVQKAAPVELKKQRAEAAETVPNPAAQLAASGPPVDVDKVAKVRAMIANGSYNLDIQAIANRMIDIDILPTG